MDKILPEKAVCISCAKVFSLPEQGDVVCPRCGHSVSKERYERLVKMAAEAVYFGYRYRNAYSDLNEDEEGARYFLPPLGDVVVFLGLSALSGLIGNAAWSLVQKAISEIIEEAEKQGVDRNLDLAWKIRKDKRDFRDFVNKVEDFYSGLEGVDPELKSAIMEEILAEQITRDSMKGSGPIPDPSDEESTRAAVEQAMRSIKKRNENRPEPEDFEDFWKHLSMSG